MLDLSTECKSIPFLLDGVSLVMTEYTVQDVDRLIELQKPLLGLDGVDTINDLFITRVMCSVKTPDGDYFWDGDLESFKTKKYPQNMFTTLVDECNKLNPIKTDKLEAKKKSS